MHTSLLKRSVKTACLILEVRMDGWMVDGCVGGCWWVGGWVDGMGGDIYTYIYRYIHPSIHTHTYSFVEGTDPSTPLTGIHARTHAST